MGTFTASLRTVGDVSTLSATIELSDGRLSIVAGNTEIGSWPLSEIHLEEIPTGYRMAVEGELLLLEFKDVSSFSEELSKASRKRRFIGRKKQPDTTEDVDEDEPAEAVVQEPVVAPPPTQPAEAVEEPAAIIATEPQVTGDKTGVTGKILDSVDGLLLKAHKRYAAYLPGWVFSRGMLVICLALVALGVVFPGAASMVILVVGGLTLLFGAVVYSDSVLASRWLPGRSTPQQALITGLTIFLVGILLGVIAG